MEQSMIKHTNGHTNGNGRAKLAAYVGSGSKVVKKVGMSGTVAFLVVHTIVLAAIFTLKFFGLASDYILAIAAALIALEVVYLAFLTRLKVNIIARDFKEMEAKMQEVREESVAVAKMQRELLYFGHQVKTDQRLSQNGHQRRIHA